MKTVLILILICVCLHAENESIPASVYHTSATRVLKTPDRKVAAEKISKRIIGMDGWQVKWTAKEISLRIPEDSLKKFLLTVDSLGLIPDHSFNRVDHTSAYLKLIASLQSKEYLLEQYFAILDSSGFDGIYPVSKAIVELQNNVEMLKGQIRGMLERMEYAEVKIYFDFNDRKPPLTSGHSNFGWLNSVNHSSLLQEFK
jgi:hypothetical protein